MTVGECAGVDIPNAKRYANSQGTELNMVFQFEHVGLDNGSGDKWSKGKIYLPALKENLSKWQSELNGVAWNSIFFCNHDQPRIVSRLGDNSPKSAKCIATMLHLMQGTPYVYQGEELGMTNCPFGPIENYRDIESVNAYHELTQAGLREPEELLSCIAYKSRDNARTPMQWDDSENAGFTTGKPWIMVNPNYTTLNARAELADEDSVFHYYRRLIALRRESEWKSEIVYGDYQLLAPEDEQIFAYLRKGERTLLVVCNLSEQNREFVVPNGVMWDSSKLIIGNDAAPALSRTLSLKPWDAFVWCVDRQ
jgi:oligo-1,6-glucosidase